MTRKTKKVGMTGSFGPRYGSQVRKRFLKVENDRSALHKCPSCASPKVNRKSIGVWICKKCGYTFAGGAWIPTTPSGKSATRAAQGLGQQPIVEKPEK